MERIDCYIHSFIFLIKIQIRMILYIFTTLAEDVETQRKGQISISMYSAEDLVSMSRTKDNDLYTTLVQGSPVRFTASHFCLTSNSAALVLARTFVYFAVAVKDGRPRTKCYDGLGLETQYTLMGFGIPVADLPITSSMSIKTKNHHRWIKNRKMLEAARARGEDTSHWIVYPCIHDVLFRQGGNYTRHVNVEFSDIIASKMDTYISGNAPLKELVREEIITAVHAKGGKFLEYNRKLGLWIQIQDMRIVSEKIHSAIYYHNVRMNARQPRQKSSCQTDRFIEANKRRKIGEDRCCECI
jgi:hypothetical protein